jgi:hypothetical protein
MEVICETLGGVTVGVVSGIEAGMFFAAEGLLLGTAVEFVDLRH